MPRSSKTIRIAERLLHRCRLGGEAHSNSYRAARLAKDGNGDLGDQVQLAELQLVQLLAPPGGAGALIIRANTCLT